MIKVTSNRIQNALCGLDEVIEVVKFGNVCIPARKLSAVIGMVI